MHSTHCVDENDAPFIGQRGDFAGQIVATDHVEDYIYTAAAGSFLHHGDEVLGFVIDGAGRAQSFAGRALLRVAGSGKYRVAERVSNLDRTHPDSARASLDQQAFTAGKVRAIEDVAPDGE